MYFDWFDSFDYTQDKYAHHKSAQGKQKGFAHILIIAGTLIAISVTGGIYYFNKAKPAKYQNQLPAKQIVKQSLLPVSLPPLSELNTYSDNYFKFEFKTSKDLSVQKDSEEEFDKRGNGNYRKNFTNYVGYEPSQPLGAIAVLDSTHSFETNPLSVWVFDNNKRLTAEQWFQNYWYYPFVWGVFDYTSKGHIALDQAATISGQPAKYKIVTYQPGKPKFIYIAKDQKMFLFRIIGETGEKILSSFRFL